MYVNRFFGYSLHFANGLSVGFNWVHGNGKTSKTSACLIGYHPPKSVTWRWAIYWEKPSNALAPPSFNKWCGPGGHGFVSVQLPIIGGLTFRWQPRWRANVK